ncbi:hypothetical protein [Pseudoclavibacter sp. Z016]|uniref:hypothetical protein n=1 Tax=Pseudoclavibacter sp. Z016 TaxID=2080581 RepID=UPI000CE767F1|nr:hypothetical protein [Pseudoclavibacter sp. Z016]PPF78429.1 hypothetical protein C5B99_00565 [Pseudoclavibacter sp. Z016]
MASDFEDQTPDSRATSPSRDQAQAALDDLGHDSQGLAARIVTPWWYHPALGVITAIFAGAHALPGAWPMVLLVLGIVAIPILTTTYSRRFGVVVTKPAGPRSKRLLLATLGVLVAAMMSSLAFKFLSIDPWWALIPAGVTFMATVILGRRYDEALRQEVAAPKVAGA